MSGYFGFLQNLMKVAKPMAAKRADRSLQKREAILSAARNALLDSAINAPSIETIARLAGVSKVTIYKHFAGQDGLWSALIDEALKAALPIDDGDIDIDASFEQNLSAIGEKFVSLQANPLIQSARLAAMFMGDRCSGASADLASATYGRFLSQLVCLFRDVEKAEGLIIEDAELAAEQFLALCASRFMDKSKHSFNAHESGQASCAQIHNATLTFFRAFSKK